MDAGDEVPIDWETKVLALRQDFNRLCGVITRLQDEGALSSEQDAEIWRNYANTTVRHSGSDGLTFDALGYGLLRNGIHQMKCKLIEFCPQAKDELDRILP